MCHGTYEYAMWLQPDCAAEDRETATDDGVPDFLNAESDAEVELLTDGGTE